MKKTWREILYDIAGKHGFYPDDLTGPSRKRDVTDARREFAKVMHEQHKFPKARIAEILKKHRKSIEEYFY